MHSHEQLQILVKSDTNAPCFVYAVWRDPEDNYMLTWPFDNKNPSFLQLPASQSMIIPRVLSEKRADHMVPQWFALDDQIGLETIYILAHASNKADVEVFLSGLNDLDPEVRNQVFLDWCGTFAWEKTITFMHTDAD